MRVGLDLFSERDFSQVTIKDIGSAAKVNTAMIYYYFKNKEDLFKASVEHAILQAMENYGRLRERHSNPIDLINDWFDNNIEMAEPLLKLVKLMMNYSTSHNRLLTVDKLIRHFYREETSILSSSIRQGMATGIFREVDAEEAANFVSVHLDGIMVASMIRSDFDLPHAVSELRSQLWLRLLPDQTAPVAAPAAAAG